MADFEFHDNTAKVKEVLEQLAYKTLEEVAGELESQVKRNHDPYVDTGQTKNSWSHHVSANANNDEFMSVVGSDYENAIWEEFGTGEYALNGDGRKGGWFYVDAEGKGHFTYGKHPRRQFFNAYTKLKNKLIRHMQNAFKGKLS